MYFLLDLYQMTWMGWQFGGRVDKSRICAASDINFTPRWDLLITHKIILAWLGIGTGNGNRSSHVRDMQYHCAGIYGPSAARWYIFEWLPQFHMPHAHSLIIFARDRLRRFKWETTYAFLTSIDGKNFRNTLKLMDSHELHSRAKLRPRNNKLNQFWFAWFTLVQLFNSSKKWCLVTNSVSQKYIHRWLF